MFRCCFRPEVEDDVSILAMRTASNQPRSRVVPALTAAISDPTLRGRQHASLSTSNASAHGGIQVQGLPASGCSTSGRLAGSWGNGSGKAAYKDPDKDCSFSKGLLGLLSRGGSADMFHSEASRGGSRKLAASGGGGGGSGDNTGNVGDDGCTALELSVQGGPGSRHGSKLALASHLKTAQPKRGILKKNDTPLDAAAAGDEEALLRLANSLALITDTTASTIAPGTAMIKATVSSRLRPSSTSGGAVGVLSSAATAPLAVGTATLVQNSSITSSADIALEQLQTSSCRNSGNAWTDAAAAAVNAVGSVGGSAGALRVYPSSCSGGSSFQTSWTAACGSGNQHSRLANSSTAMAALGIGEEALGSGPAATPAATQPPVASPAARAISIRSAAIGAVTGLGSSSWASGPSVLYARDPGAVPAVAADFDKCLGRSGGGGSITDATGKLTRATSVSLAQLQLQPQLDSLALPQTVRQLSHITTSYIVQVAPPAPPPAGSTSNVSPLTVRSYGSAPGAPPGDPSVQSGASGGQGSGLAVKMPGFECISLPSHNTVACGNGGGSGNLTRSVRTGSMTAVVSRRGNQLSAAAREEILRSLPPGKSPIWYAHKLREILGTAEGDGGDDVCGDGSGAAASAPVEDSEDSPRDRSARLNFAASGAGDASVGRKVSFARLGLGTTGPGDGVSISTGRVAAGDPPVVVAALTPPVQRTTSRLLSPNGVQQPAVSVRYLSGLVSPFASGGPAMSALGQGPADAWTSAHQIALPGSMALQDPSPAASSVSGMSAATLGGRSRLAVERSAGSASGVGSAAASSVAAAATALERLRCSGAMVTGGDKIQSEPLAKLRQLKMYESMGKMYDPNTAPKDAFGQPSVQQLVGAVPAPFPPSTAGAAAGPAPVFGALPLGTSPSPSPVLILEGASRKLSDLLAALGTGGTVIHEEVEEDGE
ncbi:hypothetical protein VaNZ11_017035 [Volvox africanus]|uniref:Uncharacterized protein n=1 Tax=Volvox africanus TaxID=51714 RepID=A0ABQ5SQ34_9CHLO|nr:hypothetical protein VaNZ11_017035 [Volvox africanus]